MDSFVDLAAIPLAEQAFLEEGVFPDLVSTAWLLLVVFSLLLDNASFGGRRGEFELW